MEFVGFELLVSGLVVKLIIVEFVVAVLDVIDDSHFELLVGFECAL